MAHGGVGCVAESGERFEQSEAGGGRRSGLDELATIHGPRSSCRRVYSVDGEGTTRFIGKSFLTSYERDDSLGATSEWRKWRYTFTMTFWLEVAAGFLSNIFAGVLLVVFYVAIQWFLQVTDITIGYNWRFDGTLDNPRNLRPNFDIRNLSRSRTYVLSSIAYLKDKRPVAPFDSKSVWGVELKPGSIEFREAAPVASFTSLDQCMKTEVHVRLQGKRLFWLQGVGPGQIHLGRLQRMAFWLRDKFEKAAFPLE